MGCLESCANRYVILFSKLFCLDAYLHTLKMWTSYSQSVHVMCTFYLTKVSDHLFLCLLLQSYCCFTLEYQIDTICNEKSNHLRWGLKREGPENYKKISTSISASLPNLYWSLPASLTELTRDMLWKFQIIKASCLYKYPWQSKSDNEALFADNWKLLDFFLLK